MNSWLAASTCLVGALACACSEHVQLAARTGGGGRWLPDHFWPPPSATAVWASEPCVGDANATFGDLAERVRAALDGAGYEHGPWLAIGAEYEHGFAVLTRLERARDDRAAPAAGERFSPRFPDAPTFEWLEGARAGGASGRHRVLLVAVTDLPFVPVPHRAPLWNASTWLGEAKVAMPSARRANGRYRVGAFLYAYESAAEGEGADRMEARFVPADAPSACAAVAGARRSLAALPWAPCPAVASPRCAP